MNEHNYNSKGLFYKQYLIDIRRERVLELASQGLSQTEIAFKINCSQALVSLDLQFLKCQAASNIKTWVDELIPLEFNKTIAGYNLIIKTAWQAAQNDNVDVRDRLAALQLLASAYEQKMNMMSNSTLIDKAVQKINNMKKELEEIRQNSSNNSSSIDYGVDNSYDDNNKEKDSQAKFGYSCDGTVGPPLGHYDAKVGHMVYEPWEIELHANLVKWNEEYKQKKAQESKINNEYEQDDGNRQF